MDSGEVAGGPGGDGVVIHSFSQPPDGSDEERRRRLGGKGAGLAAMTAAGLPVPPGFTLTTDACRTFLAQGWQPSFDTAVADAVAGLETATGKGLGRSDAPLLVSVRSGAPVSMPGMMDTVLNVGMTDEVEAALAAQTGDPAFAADTHRRFLVGYAHVVLGVDAEVLTGLDQPSDGAQATPGQIRDRLAAQGHVVPTDPHQQVRAAVRAVFESWTGERAVHYRRIEGIDDSMGTAATVQAMVFGNLCPTSGTGVAFTRDPSTGEPGLMGDFLAQAQGEDVVAGDHATLELAAMADQWPEQWSELLRVAAILEQQYQDLVDIEFTVERGTLWLLQARVGKRSPRAAVRVAVDLAEDAAFAVDRAEAVARCRDLLDDPPLITTGGDGSLEVVASGLGASPGVAAGLLCVDVDEAVRLEADGQAVILARPQTSPADVHGMAAAKGIFTTLGGRVSHAAVVARSWGTPAVVGAAEAQVTSDGVTVGERLLPVGSLVTVDGDRGLLLSGAGEPVGVPAPEALTLQRWAAELGGAADDGAAPGPPADPVADSAANAGAGTGADAGGGGGGADVRFGALHALRIKGMATADVVEAMVGRPADEVAPVLAGLLDEGSATFMEARGFWMISAEGRERHAELLAAEVAGLDADAVPYARFLDLNGAFKVLCTDWQLRDGEPNDHSDAAYDAAIAERLIALDVEAQESLASLVAVIGRLHTYGPRLAAALERFRGGDQKALTGVLCDSYHDIWMELHEDLILTLGIDRVAEGSG